MDLADLKLLATLVHGWELAQLGRFDSSWFTQPYTPLIKHLGKPEVVPTSMPFWDPFTSAQDAVELAEAMQKRGYWIECGRLADYWTCTVCRQYDCGTTTKAVTFQEAVAYAILRALQVETDKPANPPTDGPQG